MNASFFAAEDAMGQSPIGIFKLLVILGIIVIVAIIILIARARRKGNKGEANVAGPGAPVPRIEPQREAMGGYVKRCPTCQSIYTDETLAFCLSDGSTLERVANPSPPTDPNATLAYQEAKRSDVAPTVQYQPDTPLNKKG
jgi:hypothetical protein